MKLLTFTFIFLLSTFSYAEEKTVEEHCNSWHKLATAFMTAHMNEVPITKIIDALEGHDEYKFLVHRAYKHHRLFSEAAKRRQIIDFGNEIYLECIESNQ